MITSQAEKLVTNYTKWLQSSISTKQMEHGWVEITTPFLDRYNDHLQIYVKGENNEYELSDDGYIIDDLISSGCDLNTPKRQSLLAQTLAGFGVKKVEDCLTIHASTDNFPQKKHNLLQAMMAVNDLFYTATPYVASLFMEDVANWLDVNNVRYTSHIKFAGKSGYDHMFDFVIPKSQTETERIVQAVSNPRKNSVEALAFKWIDSRSNRPMNSRLIAFLNDENGPVPSSVTEALTNYDIFAAPWSKRDDLVGTFAN